MSNSRDVLVSPALNFGLGSSAWLLCPAANPVASNQYQSGNAQSAGISSVYSLFALIARLQAKPITRTFFEPLF